MKTKPTPVPKEGAAFVVREDGVEKFVVHDSQGPSAKQETMVEAPVISYDQEGIEESNRIGAALCRQNAL